jgi:pyridoxamine 5'-phosphate oxidase
VPGPEDDPAQAGVGEHIPRPPHWGGYHIYAEAVELWLEGESRIHDRARWTRTLRWPEGAAAADETARPVIAGAWRATRLQP